MQTTEQDNKRYTPGSVPVASQNKIYYSADVQAAGGIEAFLKSINSDKPKVLPEIDFTEEEWAQMLKADL